MIGTPESAASHDLSEPVVTAPSAPIEPTVQQFLALVREDLETNGGDWRYPGFQALFVYRVGRLRRGAGSRVLRRLLRTVYPFLYRRARDRFSIEIHETNLIGRRVRFIHQGAIVLHPYAIVGDDCWIRHGVTLGGRSGYAPDVHPTLGRDVRIGVGAVLMGRIRIGDGVRIGPNAVVETDVPAGATVIAPPSSVVRIRNTRRTQDAGSDGRR